MLTRMEMVMGRDPEVAEATAMPSARTASDASGGQTTGAAGLGEGIEALDRLATERLQQAIEAMPELDGPEVDEPEPIERYVEAVEELAGLLLEHASLEDLLEQVLELTSRAVAPTAAVSVTIVNDDGSYVTAAASSADAVELDELQYGLREGPCIDALEQGVEHWLDDLATDGSFQPFRDRAREAGFGSVLAIPLSAGGCVVGALNLFAAERTGFAEADRDVARRIAAPAAATLANAAAYRRAVRLIEQLHAAIDSRAVIEQAKGIIAAQQRCDPEQAFGLLRRASQGNNRKVRSIAEAVVAGAVEPGRERRSGTG